MVHEHSASDDGFLRQRCATRSFGRFWSGPQSITQHGILVDPRALVFPHLALCAAELLGDAFQRDGEGARRGGMLALPVEEQATAAMDADVAGEAAIARLLIEELRSIGLRVEVQEAAPDRPNVVGILDGRASGRSARCA